VVEGGGSGERGAVGAVGWVARGFGGGRCGLSLWRVRAGVLLGCEGMWVFLLGAAGEFDVVRESGGDVGEDLALFFCQVGSEACC